jgi:succinate dehydrogenase hydrophobic anchor subunit
VENRSLNSASSRRWLIQAGSGLALVILLAIHFIVNHWVSPRGLLSYSDVIRYYDVAGVAWMESVFLITVTVHCVLGLQSFVLDLNLGPNITRSLIRLLIFAGTVTISYGIWLIRSIVTLSVA